MADPQLVARLRSGARAWNAWRADRESRRGPTTIFYDDLRAADLRGLDLSYVQLTSANLVGADLSDATLFYADLSGSTLTGVDLRGAKLFSARMESCDLRNARMQGADLTYVSLNRSKLIDANLAGCRVYGISAWDVQMQGAVQDGLRIQGFNESPITVDSLEVAQFLHLLIRNDRVADALDALSNKIVLVLGRFSEERKPVLDAVKKHLRTANYLPILFDFPAQRNRDSLETVTTLARLSRFVIADITEPRSIPQELQAIVPQVPSLPVQPILARGHQPWGMFDHLQSYPNMLPIREYDNVHDLVSTVLPEALISLEAAFTGTRSAG